MQRTHKSVFPSIRQCAGFLRVIKALPKEVSPIIGRPLLNFAKERVFQDDNAEPCNSYSVEVPMAGADQFRLGSVWSMDRFVLKAREVFLI